MAVPASNNTNEKLTELIFKSLDTDDAAFLRDSVVIRGKVENEKGKPFRGAMIIEYDKNGKEIQGTTTDAEGNFHLKIQDNNSILKCSGIGYNPIILNIKKQTEFNIRLEKKAKEIVLE